MKQMTVFICRKCGSQVPNDWTELEMHSLLHSEILLDGLDGPLPSTPHDLKKLLEEDTP